MNAFLAVDVDIDTDDIDAITQSIEYSRCSNATVFIVPFLGHNSRNVTRASLSP